MLTPEDKLRALQNLQRLFRAHKEGGEEEMRREIGRMFPGASQTGKAPATDDVSPDSADES